jgi:hypothetical protein
MRASADGAAAPEGDLTAAGLIESAGEIENRRLARSVRTDEPEHLTRRKRKIDVVNRSRPTEMFLEMHYPLPLRPRIIAVTWFKPKTHDKGLIFFL